MLRLIPAIDNVTAGICWPFLNGQERRFAADVVGVHYTGELRALRRV